MLNKGDHSARDAIASSLDWWLGAGLGSFVDEAPRDWLAPPARHSLPSEGHHPEAPATLRDAPPPPTTAPAAPLPDDLAALQTLLTTGAYIPGAPPARMRVPPAGDPAAGLMIVSDMPEQGDDAAGRLFAGETQKLFDAMLAAMGRSRETVYLAPLSPARATGGRLDPATGLALARLMRRHIALAQPRALILFGEEAARLLLDADAGRRGLLAVNHESGRVPAIVAVHPRLLRQAPARKAEVWADMRLLLGVLAR